MTTIVVATNSVHTSATLSDYLADRVDDGDAVHAVNSQVGGDRTSAEEIRDGEDALNAVYSRLGAKATVETHQLVRGNEPAQDVLAYAEEVDAGEVVIGVGRRDSDGGSPVGSTAREILSSAERPVIVVPGEDPE